MTMRVPGRKITYVKVACSGAATCKGLLEPQRDYQAVGQIDELIQLLTVDGKLIRRPDVLTVTTGANDLEFADALEEMAKNVDTAWWQNFLMQRVPFGAVYSLLRHAAFPEKS